MCHRQTQTDRQTDGLMNKSDFIGHLLQKWRFDHVFQKFESKILNYLDSLVTATVKELTITKSPVIQIQNLLMNPKSQPIKLISK